MKLTFLILISIFALGCLSVSALSKIGRDYSKEVSAIMDDTVSAEGVIEKQGITSYQYGTHVLKDGKKTLYALTSKSVKLNDYVGKRVKVTGTPIDGYPLEGGPAFLEVTKVEPVK